MPYANIHELPPAVRGALPRRAQRIYRAAFNSFAGVNPDKDEGHAHAVAWSAVKNKFRKEGDEWVAKDEMGQTYGVVHPVGVSDANIITRGTFSDVAMIDASPQRTADGYMKAFARVARTGIQVYKGHELGRPSVDEVRIYRPPDEVFAADAMKSLAHRPLTLHHPRENVGAKNWRHYSVGYTGEDVVRDGDHVRVPLMLCDQAAIDAVTHDKVKQLSVGYSADVRWSPGITPLGEKYDAVQAGIRANHVAIVPDARGGDKLAIGDQNRHQLSGQFMHTGSHSMDQKMCPECGDDVNQNEDECPECGHVFGGGQHFGDDSRPKFTCWSCGQSIPQDTEICPYCRESQIAPRDDEIETQADLDNAIKALSRGKLFSANKSRIIKAAKRLGKVQSLPEDWNIAENIGDAAAGRMNIFDKEFSTKRRQKLAKEGKAMPSGGYPIENRADLGRAIQAFGRSVNAGNGPATKRWIIKRAKELGATKELPESWNVSDGLKGEGTMHLMIDGVLVELSDGAGAIVQKALNGLKQQVKDARKRDQDYSSGKNEKTANEAGGGQKYDEYDADGDDDDDDDDEQEAEMKRGAKQRREDRRDAKDGVIAGLKKKLADAEAALKPEALDKLVANRQALIDAASTVLDQNYAYRGKTDAQVRRDAVAAAGIDVAKMNDAQVEGAFLTVTDGGKQQRQGNGFTRMVDGLSRGMAMSDRDLFNQRANMGPRNGVVSPEAMRDAAFVSRERYLNTAWQGGRGADVHGHNTNDFGRR